MNAPRTLWWSLSFVSSLVVAATILAQSSDRPFQKKMTDFFQGKKNSPQPQPSQSQQQTAPLREDSSRLVEILVELAWLADPYTFPFYLEAHVDQGHLEVRGNVPSRVVREQALKIARLQSPLAILDSVKENPALTVKPLRMSTGQLQNAVNTALAETMPRQARNLRARCAADGRVAVTGNVSSFEEKLAISQALRRLHGCTAVNNMVQVAYDPDGSLARTYSRAPAKATPTPEGPSPTSRSTANANGANEKPARTPGTLTSNPRNEPTAEPRIDDRNPAVDLGRPLNPPAPTPEIGTNPLAPRKPVMEPTSKEAPRLTPVQLKKRIEQACPAAREIKLTFSTPTDLRIELHPARAEDSDQLAGQVLSLPELQSYKVDLTIMIPQQK